MYSQKNTLYPAVLIFKGISLLVVEFYTESPNMPKIDTLITISDNISNWQIKYNSGIQASKMTISSL